MSKSGEILDVTSTANRPGCFRAERKGLLALVLTKCDRPVRCADGVRRSYQVEEIILSEEENELACVSVNEFNYYSQKDVRPVLEGRATLFDTVPFN